MRSIPLTLIEGNVNLGELSIITTSYDDIDYVFGEQTKPASAGNINIKGGSVNVTGRSIFSTEGEVNVSDNGVLSIEAEKTLYVSKDPIPDGHEIIITKKGTINLTDTGIINLSGGLFSHVDGDGSLNFKTSNALVDGNVDGSNLSFDANHSLSQAISGTIGDLAALNVNGGLLNFDKQTGKITDLNVKNGAGLNIGTNTVNATSVDFADNSSLNFQVSGLDMLIPTLILIQSAEKPKLIHTPPLLMVNTNLATGM